MRAAWAVRPPEARGPGRAAVGGLAVVLFVAAAFTSLPNRAARWLAVGRPMEQTAAIVVLAGGGLRADGTLTDVSQQRTLQGVRLHHAGLAPLLVLSGARSGGWGEAQVRAALARMCGVASTAILIEDRGRTTREEADYIAAQLRPRGVHRIVLVGDATGMRRAVGAFARSGLEALPAASDDVAGVSRPEDRLGLSRSVAMELVAWLYYRLAGWV
jgi:uncharacterized SAM-binding protein YcdF (DUF218 family)